MKRIRLVIRGAVQGVGFRPFVYRTATAMGLNGWVRNSGQGVLIEAEGPAAALTEFLLAVDRDKPSRSHVHSFEYLFLEPRGMQGFEIQESESSSTADVLVLPDIATCASCVSEVFDASNRRYRYPFTNCTHCGPRYSIVRSLPYDRDKTSMQGFDMCSECAREYNDPADRRFHAQPIACPLCGPQVELRDADGATLATADRAVRAAAEQLRLGRIVAVKGIGGFHFLVDARDSQAVDRLRDRKHRDEKPLAVMYPDEESVRRDCDLSSLELRCLTGPEAPIVLLRRRADAVISSRIAPGNPDVGAMLPYSPLHHLLLSDLGVPVVATSGNLSDEPICIDEQAALDRLHGVADCFLVHNRPIERPVDDSVVRVILGGEQILRRGRGYAPLPPCGVPMAHDNPRPIAILALGAHMKNNVALSVRDQIVVSQHLGDLESEDASHVFGRTVDDLRSWYSASIDACVVDQHPDYFSTRYGQATGLPLTTLQHHAAHVYSCMAENELDGAVLGVAWDGTGYGPDGTIWGGEFLVTSGADWQRAGSIRSFRLPGGSQAVREPRRSALGVLFEIQSEAVFGRDASEINRMFSSVELANLRSMLTRGVHSPSTTSMGRLFDAMASLLSLRYQSAFEGQAAMDVEFAATQADPCEADQTDTLSIPIREHIASALDGSDPKLQPRWILDWAPFVATLLSQKRAGAAISRLAAEFHEGLARAIVGIAERCGQERVVLTGGCFQNRLLTECSVRRLRMAGFKPFWHQRVPPNDGGIALGQVYAKQLQRVRDRGSESGMGASCVQS